MAIRIENLSINGDGGWTLAVNVAAFAWSTPAGGVPNSSCLRQGLKLRRR
jgi:hypothetical protein